MDWGTGILSLFSAALGGLIGTYFGAKRISSDEEQKKQKIRNIALKALTVIKKYANEKKKYTAATDDFNNSLNLSEKRAILVALHKVGVPIAMPSTGVFSVKDVTFLEEEISEKELDDMQNQLQSGHCDSLFFIDVDTYFNDGLRIKTKRNLAARYVNSVLRKSNIAKEDKHGETYLVQKLPKNWQANFSVGERHLLHVFFKKTFHLDYYESEKFLPAEADKLIKEIEAGYWDTALEWDGNAYENVESQRRVADLTSQILGGIATPTAP